MRSPSQTTQACTARCSHVLLVCFARDGLTKHMFGMVITIFGCFAFHVTAHPALARGVWHCLSRAACFLASMAHPACVDLLVAGEAP
eukprot:4076444-Alexandrium_andersonii.AAC.1